MALGFASRIDYEPGQRRDRLRRLGFVSTPNGYGVPLPVIGRVIGLPTANAARNVTRSASMSCCGRL